MTKKKGKDESSREELESLKNQVEDYKSKYLRALADYQNFETREQNEKKRLIQTANKHILLKLLPFVDNVSAAEIFVKDEGLRIVKDQLLALLKEEGVSEIEELVGKEYDPHSAEAVDMVGGEKDNIVVEVVRPGYMLRETVLRPAQVKVSRKITN